MQIKVVTPNGVIYDKKAISITLPTKTGVITVLEDHQPLVSILEAGEILIIESEEDQKFMSVSSGLIEIQNGSLVYIMADTAERAEEIDLERAEEAVAKAKAELEKVYALEDIDFARLQASIDKELARVNVGRKYRNLRRR